MKELKEKNDSLTRIKKDLEFKLTQLLQKQKEKVE